MKKLSSILAIGLFILTACAPASQTSAGPLFATPSPQPTALKVLPTPSSPGDPITWDNLQVTMDELEVTQDYMTDYGSSRIPPAGQKFLWVNIRLENGGQNEMEVPISEHFSVLYAGTELKPSYGHRLGHLDYTTLGTVIFPNQELDSWLRFDIPTAAELKDLRFVFLPESSQVGTSYSSPNYPYAEDKPTYVWNCAP
jgi:Telomeric repeat-binding factor 2.